MVRKLLKSMSEDFRVGSGKIAEVVTINHRNRLEHWKTKNCVTRMEKKKKKKEEVSVNISNGILGR